MDLNNTNTDSQDSGEPDPPGTSGFTDKKLTPLIKNVTNSPMRSPSSPGMLQAKKKLRAFSIQKKAALPTPITVPKPITSGNTTVLIGKLSGVKVTPKPDPDPDGKKPPKPPKPGLNRKLYQENYTENQKKNVAEIEDMKRKMELVELGIPLGLICPTSSSVQAMPTKAMPPIKSFLDPAKVDDLIRQAKKAKAEGKDFKFELSKFLPDYDNPFQRKKDKDDEEERKECKDPPRKESKWKSDRYEFKRHNDHRKKDDKSKFKDRSKDRDKEKDKRDDKKQEPKKDVAVKEKSTRDAKETDVNLNDYLVCDSWSLDTEEKTNSSSPKAIDKLSKATASIPLPEDIPKGEKLKEVIGKSIESKDVGQKPIEPVNVPKLEKLQPVMDSFKYELDSNEDEPEDLDIFDKDTDIGKYANPTIKKNKPFESPVSLKLYDYDQEPTTADDENFLESVINEIKQEDMSDISQDKGLVEYDLSPSKDEITMSNVRESVTPELDDRMRDLRKQRGTDYSDGYRSSESGYKSRESGYKSDLSDSFRLSVEKDAALEQKMSQSMVDSLETWSFILKICQPLLFRHDKNKCYKETHSMPKLWYTENPRRCTCVKDRAVVYDELETCKMPLVDRVYGIDQIEEEPLATCQQWYPRHTSWAPVLPALSEWETEEPPRVADTPRSEEVYLDREYQRFMEAVWPEVSDKPDTPPDLTPVRESRKKKKSDDGEEKRKVKKMKPSSEGWSQDSEVEEDAEKSKKSKEKDRRKRKLSTTADADSDDGRKEKRTAKRKVSKKLKAKEAKRRRLNKKLRKLKEKNKKKKKLKDKSDAESGDDKEKEKKKEKKPKKKKQLKPKKAQKKKKARAKYTSSSSSSESSSESSSDDKKKKKIEKKKKKKKEKKRKQSSDSTQSEELFDVNILNNIKTERETDDEKRMEFSPRRQGERPREIINVKELQNDFVGNNIHIKQEKEDEKQEAEKEFTPEVESVTTPIQETEEKVEFKEPEPQSPKQDVQPKTVPPPKTTPQPLPSPLPAPASLDLPEEASQGSSQDSLPCKDYEKDDSHLRPSSQNSNYSFNDVIASHAYHKGEEITTVGYQKGMPAVCEEDAFQKEEYLPADYELYEQMAMAYQSDVASQQSSTAADASADVSLDSQRIETVVGSRLGEIKCDWRPGDRPAPPPHRPSRWGLKPSEVNIVLTGGDQYQPPPRPAPAQTVYKIESIANRSADNNTSMSYDEAYMDMYGAADRLQYGDCFSAPPPPPPATPAPPAPPAKPVLQAHIKDPRRSTLDDRIHLALKNTVLGEVAKEDKTEDEKEKGILISKVAASRASKRVRFADGYAPGQDSDTEAPPKKKKKSRRYGCAWPCPATHPDHVPLWDALPPPPPPASPPPPPVSVPPPALLAALRRPAGLPGSLMSDPMLQQQLAHHQQKFEPNSLPPFMPPEPPPGMINFH